MEAIKELMIAEARTIADIRKKLIEKYIDAAPEDRLRLRQDIEMAEKDLRQLGIYQKAIEHVPESQTTSNPTSSAEDLEPPVEFIAWLDTFNEYARKKNEPWREGLLSRALALESVSPGVIGPRALWFIGTIDEKSFHAFAAVLDISINIGGGYVIPKHGPYITRIIPTCILGPNIQLGNVLFLLGDLGLIGDLLTTQKTFPPNSLLTASYGTHNLIAITQQELKLKGVILTSLGDTIARLYEPKTNDLGFEIYKDWRGKVPDTSLQIINET